MTLFETRTRVHIVGVAGAGMSGVARLLVEMGCEVSGSDASDSLVLEELANDGVKVFRGHQASNVLGAGVVTWSPAVALDNIELESARANGATLMNRAEILSLLAGSQRVLGITGTHGKTTATSMLVHVMHAAHRDDSRLLGADVAGVGANGHFGTDDLILEVDESFGSFTRLSPYALGILNVEADHLDHYGSLEALESAFVELVERCSGPVVFFDEPGAQRVRQRVRRHSVVVGRDTSATWHIGTAALQRRSANFLLKGNGRELDIHLNVTGEHNVTNAAVVAALALEMSIDPGAVIEGLARFEGAPRRYQFLGAWRGVDVYEDYAHLPSEVRATVAATRATGYSKIGVVFQPHRYTRTHHLATTFDQSFDDASVVMITDVYAAGESPLEGVSGELIVNAVKSHAPNATILSTPRFVDVAHALERVHDDLDVVLLLGAGDVAAVAPMLSGGVAP